jgi:uncharacterized protein YutE (UPF0331/DUF86 family)
MNADQFKNISENLEKNVIEIKETVKNEKILEAPNRTQIFERLKYLFYSVTKSLIDIGHSIVLENEYRDPLNRADIFISLAERDIILHSVVPGVKKAALIMPKMNNYEYEELRNIIAESIGDIHKCLDSFAVYFRLKNT